MTTSDLTLVPLASTHFAVVASWFGNQRQLTQWGGAGVRHPLDAPQLEVARLDRIVIAPSLRGQRLAGPMLQLVVDRACAMPGINRVDLGVYTRNAGAIKAYARLGFVTGEVREGSTWMDG